MLRARDPGKEECKRRRRHGEPRSLAAATVDEIRGEDLRDAADHRQAVGALQLAGAAERSREERLHERDADTGTQAPGGDA
jgi:hypothetical protein